MEAGHSRWHQRKARSGRAANSRKAVEARQKKKEDAKETTEPEPTPEPTPVTTESTKTPSKSQEKLNRFASPESTFDEEYLIVQRSCLSSMIECLHCPKCSGKTLSMSVAERLGFSIKIVTNCLSCDEIVAESFTSVRINQQNTSRPPFDVNRKITTAFLDIGAGYSAIEKFCSGMNIMPMDEKSFYNHLAKIIEENANLKKKILEAARAAAREAHEEIDPTLSEEPVIDLTVSIDGSWHRRGHTSLYGFVSAIDVLTGLIVDFEILSKFCLMCSIALSKYGEDSEEFVEWKSIHDANNECSINYGEWSGNMEADGAVAMFKRSVQEGNMRYTSFLSDGDAKTLSHLNKEKPYGDNVVIEKEECVNHVSKRMGTALRNLVQDSKKVDAANKKTGAAGKKTAGAAGKKTAGLGGRGEGTLKETTIKALQGYYHNAIKSNINDVPKMKKAILATLYHCSSTNSKPRHTYCPTGVDSWCFYNKKKALKDKKKGDHDKMPIKINEASFKALLPVYQRLSSDELLNRCAKGQTQNANEALHSVIWKRSPKHIFVSKNRLEYGIIHGVGEFNMGCVALQALKSKDSAVSNISLAIAERRDRKRVAQSSHQEESSTKKQRLLKKRKTVKKKGKGEQLYAAGAGD